MRASISILLLFIGSLAFAQQMSYDEWTTEAKKVIRMQPKYGNAIKTKEQIEADKKLTAAYLEQAGTPRKASELLISLGYDYFNKGELKTAMSRFNQAWILDPKNENVFRAYGAIYFTFKDYVKALQQYDEGLTLNPENSALLTDKATVYMTYFQTDGIMPELDKAITLLLTSYKIDGNDQNTLVKLSGCYLLKGDCTNAWKFYNACQALGGKTITNAYTESLRQFCGNKN